MASLSIDSNEDCICLPALSKGTSATRRPPADVALEEFGARGKEVFSLFASLESRDKNQNGEGSDDSDLDRRCDLGAVLEPRAEGVPQLLRARQARLLRQHHLSPHNQSAPHQIALPTQLPETYPLCIRILCAKEEIPPAQEGAASPSMGTQESQLPAFSVLLLLYFYYHHVFTCPRYCAPPCLCTGASSRMRSRES